MTKSAIYMIITTVVSIRLIEYATVKPNTKNNADVFLGFLSKCTYEIYLVQYPVIYFAQRFLIKNIFIVPIIISSTLIISCIIYVLLNLRSKNKLFNFVRFLIFNAIFIFGSYLIIVEKDNSLEMKDLENKLNENLQIVEFKNQEYMNALKEEQEEWNKILEDMENEEIMQSIPLIQNREMRQ